MRFWVPIAAALLAIAMAGCTPSSKAKAAVPVVPVPAAAAALPAPSEPLSVPQTRVQLPPPQPVDPEALAVAPPPQTPPAATPAPPAAPPTRRAPAAPSAPPKSDPPPPPAADPARPSIQEVLPESVRNQLKVDAANSRQRIRTWLDSTKGQRLTGQAKLTRERIESFLKASNEAERRGDMREAVQLAERAEILMREMQGER